MIYTSAISSATYNINKMCIQEHNIQMISIIILVFYDKNTMYNTIEYNISSKCI